MSREYKFVCDCGKEAITFRCKNHKPRFRCHKCKIAIYCSNLTFTISYKEKYSLSDNGKFKRYINSINGFAQVYEFDFKTKDLNVLLDKIKIISENFIFE